MVDRKLTFICDCRCEVTPNEKIQSQLNKTKTKTKLTLGQLGFDNPANNAEIAVYTVNMRDLGVATRCQPLSRYKIVGSS